MRVLFLVRGWGIFFVGMLLFGAFCMVYLVAVAAVIVALCIAVVMAVVVGIQAARTQRRISRIRRDRILREFAAFHLEKSMVEDEPTQGLDPETYEPGVSSAYVQNRGVAL
jgi:hypothetical protein